METMITARHGEIADILRTRAERVFGAAGAAGDPAHGGRTSRSA